MRVNIYGAGDDDKVLVSWTCVGMCSSERFGCVKVCNMVYFGLLTRNGIEISEG